MSAALDTTSLSLSRIPSLITTHPKVQDKLRQEILDALENNGGQDLVLHILQLPACSTRAAHVRMSLQ